MGQEEGIWGSRRGLGQLLEAVEAISLHSSSIPTLLLCPHYGCLLIILQAIIHPDTNETIFMPFRMSGTVCPTQAVVNFSGNLYKTVSFFPPFLFLFWCYILKHLNQMLEVVQAPKSLRNQADLGPSIPA